MTYLSYRLRLDLIDGFHQLVRERIVESWQPYFVSFMFNHIPGKQSTKKQIMADEVSRVYQTLLPYIVRKPTSPSWKQYCPIFIGCPDLPVAKNEKELVRNLQVNEGLHFNGCLLLPPAEKCRLQEPLDKHFEKHQAQYYWDRHSLDRLHATYIRDGSMIDYALKHFKRGNVVYDDVLILPRTPSELTGGGVNICRRDQT
jgi:hypothetical protein